ncbi:MAG: hypothetical protein WCH42_01175 [Actinomycetes bacterium]
MTKKIIAVATGLSLLFIFTAAPSQAARVRTTTTSSAKVSPLHAFGPDFCC